MTLTEFLLARIAEDEAEARAASTGQVWTWDGDDLMSDHTYPIGSMTGRECIIATEGANPPNPETAGAHIARHDPARVLAECEAKRRIVELHEQWPVLVETQPTFEAVDSADPSRFATRASQQMVWLTEQEYRKRFGEEPPTAPMLRALAAVYADHPECREEWKP